jgi:CTP synthase (UTP-ammonia lyase)
MGLREADHEETNPNATRFAISALSCSLVGQQHIVRLVAGSRIQVLYGSDHSVEDYFCSYGIDPSVRAALEESGLECSARDDEGDVRAVELPDHPFYLGTLFIPQTRSTKEAPHPVLRGFENAVRERMSL